MDNHVNSMDDRVLVKISEKIGQTLDNMNVQLQLKYKYLFRKHLDANKVWSLNLSHKLLNSNYKINESSRFMTQQRLAQNYRTFKYFSADFRMFKNYLKRLIERSNF